MYPKKQAASVSLAQPIQYKNT